MKANFFPKQLENKFFSEKNWKQFFQGHFESIFFGVIFRVPQSIAVATAIDFSLFESIAVATAIESSLFKSIAVAAAIDF